VQKPGYEGENNTGRFPDDTAYGTRRSRFWSVLAGGVAGDGFGTLNVSSSAGAFHPWPACLSSAGAHFSSLAFRLFASLPWWDLVPCGGANDATTAITWGGGTFSEDDDRYVASAVTSDRTWLIAYVPGTSGGIASRSFPVDMAVLGGPARARWWNPVTGTFTRIGTFANLGEHGFTTPGSNGQGNDWVLVLDVPGARSCGRIDASGHYQAPDTVPPGPRCEISATTRGHPRAEVSATVDLQ
jgi:hypothetical protein